MYINPYKVLDISTTATEAEIRTAFKDKAKRHHPDKENGSEEVFKELQLAYDTLLDPLKRKIYDDTGVIDDTVTQLAVSDLKKLFGKITEQIKDPKELGTFDLIERVRVAVNNNKHQVANGLSWLNLKIKHFESVRQEMLTRIKKKTDKIAPDFFFTPIDELIAQTHVEIVKSQNANLVLDRIGELLGEYDYEFTAPPPALKTANDNVVKVRLKEALKTSTGAIMQEGTELTVIEWLPDGSVVAAHENGTHININGSQVFNGIPNLDKA